MGTAETANFKNADANCEPDPMFSEELRGEVATRVRESLLAGEPVVDTEGLSTRALIRVIRDVAKTRIDQVSSYIRPKRTDF